MTTHQAFEVGLFTFGEITPDPATGRPLDPAVRLREFVDLARIADDVGFGPSGRCPAEADPAARVASPMAVVMTIAIVAKSRPPRAGSVSCS